MSILRTLQTTSDGDVRARLKGVQLSKDEALSLGCRYRSATTNQTRLDVASLASPAAASLHLFADQRKYSIFGISQRLRITNGPAEFVFSEAKLFGSVMAVPARWS